MSNKEEWMSQDKPCPCGKIAELDAFNEFHAKYKCECGNKFTVNRFVKVIA